MMHALAFLPTLPLSPSRALRPAVSKRRLRSPICKAAGPDDPSARLSRPDEPPESVIESPPIPPAEFIDAEGDNSPAAAIDAPPLEKSVDIQGKQAGTVSHDDRDDELLKPTEEVAEEEPQKKRPVILRKTPPTDVVDSKPLQQPEANDDDNGEEKHQATEISQEVPVPVPESPPTPEPKANGVKMSPEQIEKAKEARIAAQNAEEESKKKKSQTREQLFGKAKDILQRVGEKTRTFELGQRARAKAEVFVEDTIKLGEAENVSQQDKLKSSAASASKSVVATITKGWEDTISPKVVKVLPSELQSISNKALASVAVGLFFAITLFPSLLSGGEKPAPKKIDAQTAMLEKKLAREKSSSPSYSSRSSAQKAVFPPEDKVATKSTAPVSPKLPDVPAPIVEPKAPPPVIPPPPPVVVEKPRVVIEAPKPLNPSDVTSPMVMSSLTKSLGTNIACITGASFDSLTAEPTVILEVTKAYHRLPAAEQRAIAQTSLQSVRALGFENVSLVEIGTGMEVARAGLNVDLEDESANLRAQVGALRKETEKLATKNASQDAEVDALNTRLTDEREEFANDRLAFEKTIRTLRADNSSLMEDLSDTRQELSKIPDRMVLEERTQEAERKAEKLEDTVEMLSRQVTTARDQQGAAEKTAAESVIAVKEANKEKDAALASVNGQIEEAQRTANERSSTAIARAEREANASVESANKKVQQAEQALANSEKASAAKLDSTTSSYEKQLADERTAKDKEVQTIQDKYAALLDDVQRKASAELDAFRKDADKKLAASQKEAKSSIEGITKERDGAVKETEKVEAKANKAAAKAEKEKSGLQARIAKLEAKLKNKAGQEEAADNVAEAVPAAAAGES